MNKLQNYFYKSIVTAAVMLVGVSSAWSQVSLGSASAFSVLGGTNVTCTSGVIAGDVGVAPGGAVPYTNTGCTVGGSVPPATNAAAVRARTDFLNAYTSIQYLPCDDTLLSTIAGPITLAPGVYCTAASLTGTEVLLTLDAKNDANATWVFKINGAFTGTNYHVVMKNGGQPCNVYWVPTAAATLTTSSLMGNILAGDTVGGSITMTGGTLVGNAFSNVAATITGGNVIGCKALSNP